MWKNIRQRKEEDQEVEKEFKDEILLEVLLRKCERRQGYIYQKVIKC